MEIALTEKFVSTVGAILKTLECPICLELLKTPISVGCGHFFCRECATGILQSAYRAPCPLCKRSFTRRSLQEAYQRQSIIAATKVLANTCAVLTGVKFNGQDHFKDDCKSDTTISIHPKKFKSSNEKSRDVSTKKRKSIENEENNENTRLENVPDVEMKDCNMNENILSTVNIECLSPNKRACFHPGDSDSEDLPSLSEILSQVKVLPKKSLSKNAEPCFVIKPSDKASELKTYSSVNRKTPKTSLPDRFDSLMGEKSQSKVATVLSSETNHDSNILSKKNVEKDAQRNLLGKSDTDVELKNKVNVLKNKTNETQSDQYISMDKDSTSRQRTYIEKNKRETELGDILKENKSNPTVELHNVSPKTTRQFNKKLNKQRKSNSNSPASNILVTEDVQSEEIEKSRNLSSHQDCYTLNEVTLSPRHHAEEPEQSGKKSFDDPDKLVGLTDTAVSVGAVASPLAAKSLSMHKSPGWSRVKEVKKDFKMKKFASLRVEKNSPKIAVISGQEAASNHDKSNRSPAEVCIKISDGKRILNSETVAMPEHTNEEPSSVLEMKNSEENEKNNDFHQEQSLSVPEAPEKNVHTSKNENKSNMPLETTEELEHSVVGAHVHDGNKPKDAAHFNTLKANSKFSESKMIINNVPTVSITSNSLICANYSDAADKISSQSIVKSQKFICELQNASALGNIDFAPRNEGLTPDYADTEYKKSALTLPTCISGNQSFHSYSVHDDDNFQYVEQSQQTSQMFGFQKAVCDNLRAVVHQQQPSMYNSYSEKTKVVKRTCLTLEEIHDYFQKSSQSNSSETICSLPFLSGLFKLHVGVADETLNISVLKVIDPNEESNNIQNNFSHLNDKCIQSSNLLFPPSLLVASSNTGSESSLPDTPEPFPYLSKQSSDLKEFKLASEFPDTVACKATHNKDVSDSIVCPVSDFMQKENILMEIGSCGSAAVEIRNRESAPVEIRNRESAPVEIRNCESAPGEIRNCGSAPVEIRNCGSAPGEIKNRENIPMEITNCENIAMEITNCENITMEITNRENDEDMMLERDADMSEIIHFPSEPAVENQPIEKHSSLQIPEDKDFEDAPSTLKDTLQAPKQLDLAEKSTILEYDVSASSNSDVICKRSNLKGGCIISDNSSSSDDKDPLKKLEQCVNQGHSLREKKPSRLSLKKKSSFKRIQVNESSDESDVEISVSDKRLSTDAKGHAFVSESPAKSMPIAEKFLSPRVLTNSVNLKKGTYGSIAGEITSTYNSMLSEDASEENTSEIILEIEDLSDKIKSLEEKLKQCNSSVLNKSPSSQSDSEDSIDLFPQSVPPTPPPPKHL